MAEEANQPQSVVKRKILNERSVLIGGLIVLSIIFLAVFVIGIASILGIQKNKPNFFPPAIQTCIKELESEKLTPDKDFVSGELIIGYEENVTENEIKNIIASYGLNWKESHLDLNSVVVKIPKESESQWICMLQKNPKIKFVELNSIVYPLE